MTESLQRDRTNEDFQEYAKLLDPCTVCDHVCSHPGCWEASRKYVRQLIRLVQNGEYDPELIFEAQRTQQLEFERQKRAKTFSRSRQPLATQKVYNLNEHFGPNLSVDGKASRQAQSIVSQISMELDIEPSSQTEQQVQTSLAPSREVDKRFVADSPLSSVRSAKSLRNEPKILSEKSNEKLIDKTVEPEKEEAGSEKLSSIFTPPVAGSPKDETPVLKDFANLPSVPPSPQILPTSKVDPLSGFKKKRTQETVMIWVAPKRVSEPKYREQVFVMTREGKATVPNKNVTNQLLPPDYEPENKFSLAGSFEREKSLALASHRSRQNTTRIIPVQEEVINELLSLPKEILSQVLEQVTAIDLLTPAKTNEVIDVIISQLHNARALELSRVADECVVSKPVPIYSNEAKKYHEQLHQSFHTDPVVGLRLSHRNMNTQNTAVKPDAISRVPDWIRDQAMVRSYNLHNQSNHKLSKVSFNSLPPLRSELGGRFNRSKSIRKHYPSLESPLQRGLMPQSSPMLSKPSSRITSAQSKLSQISAALATLPSSPYSQYRTLIERKQSAVSSTGSAGESRGVPKTPDTFISGGSNWPTGDDLADYLSGSQTLPLKQRTPEKSDVSGTRKTAMESAEISTNLGRYPSVPPPSPDVNRLGSGRKPISVPTEDARGSGALSSGDTEFKAFITEGKTDETANIQSESKIGVPKSTEHQGKASDNIENTSAKQKLAADDEHQDLKTPEKPTVTPAPTTLTTISEGSIDSLADREQLPFSKAVDQIDNNVSTTESTDEQNKLTNQIEEATDPTGEGVIVQSQVLSDLGSMSSFMGKIDGFVDQNVESAQFSQISSINKIFLADVPNLEDEREPLNLEQSMRKAKVMSARKTVRFDENKNKDT